MRYVHRFGAVFIAALLMLTMIPTASAATQINADGYYLKESDMPLYIEKLLYKHHPDILVVTGHDSLSKGQNITIPIIRKV